MDQNEEVNSINSDLIRGHIDTIILKALQAGDRYGYDIIKEIEHKSGGQYVIKQPTLYSCLKRLEVQGFVKSYWGTKSIGGRKKYFTLTDMGRELFLRNKNDWDYSRDVINRLISDDEYAPNYPEPNPDLASAKTDVHPLGAVISEEKSLDESEENIESQNILDASENENYNDSPIIVGDSYTYNAENNIEPVSSEDNIEQLSIFDSESPVNDSPVADEATDDTNEVLPLSDAEQNQSEFDSIIDDDNTDFIDKVYGEQNQESYLSNVDNTKYEPPQNNDIVDVNDYFTDVNEDEYLEEETAASVASDSLKATDGAIVIPVNEEKKDDGVVLPPPREEKQQIHGDDAKILPPQNDESESKSVDFYGYDQSLSEFDEASAIIDKEFRNVINKLISDNIIDSTANEPQEQYIDYTNVDYYKEQKQEPPPPPINEVAPVQQPVIEPVQRPVQNNNNTTPEQKNDFDVRVHNSKTIKSYNNKHYYFSNQLRLLQCGILFGIMLVEIIACFYFIEVLHNGLNITRLNLALYIIAVVIAALLPIVSFFMASTNYYKRKRINYSGKSSAIFSIVVTVLLCLIVFFLNIYGGILIKEIDNFLSSLILPMVLSTNVVVNAIIFHCLYTSGKYNVDK